MESRKQTQIDLSRADQLGILAAAAIKPAVVWEMSGGKSVAKKISPQVQKAVLRAIDDFGRGRVAWPSLDRLADNANMQRRHLIRALKALEGAGLLVIQRGDGQNGRRRDCNEYRIVWSELEILAPRYRRGKTRAPDHADEGDPFDRTREDSSSSVRRRRPASDRPVAPNAGRSRGNFGSAPGAAGSVPGTAGSVPGTAGSVPGTAGSVPGARGSVPGARGSVLGDTVSVRSAQETKPPPPPSSFALPEARREPTWEEVEEGLFSVGVQEAAEVVRDAVDRRIAPRAIIALIRVYAGQPDRWRGPGVLCYRARRFRAGQSPEDLSLWPPASPEFAARDRSRRQDESRAAAAREAARQDQLAAERVGEEARLEREHGKFLDTLSPEQIERLAGHLAPATLRFVRPRLHRRPIEGSVRLALLELIDRPPKKETPANDWQKGTVR